MTISLFDLFPTERKDDTSDIFNIMHIIDNIPNEIIQDNDFMQTFPEEIREDVIRLKKNRLFNDNTSSNYSNSRYKKIEQLQNNIIKSLGNENIKSKVLIWCNIYNDNNKVSGDVNGYSYTKRNQ